MNYCKVITRENPSGPESDYFTDAIFAGVYISPDNEYKIFARISRKDSAGVDIRVHHNGTYKDLRADFATGHIPNVSWYTLNSDRMGGIYIVPIENKSDEFFVRVMAYTKYNGLAAESATSTINNYAYANHAIVVNAESVISNFGYSYLGDATQIADNQIITNPRLVSCYWNETYQSYYFRMMWTNASSNTSNLVYMKPGVFDSVIYGGNRSVSDPNFGIIQTAGVASGYYDSNASVNANNSNFLYFSKFVSDTEILCYVFECKTSSWSCKILSLTFTSNKTVSSTTVLSAKTATTTNVHNLAGNGSYYKNWGYPYLYHIWGEDNSLEIYVVSLLMTDDSNGRVTLLKCSVSPDMTNFTESNNFEIIGYLSGKMTATPSNAMFSNIWAGFRILGFLNGDRSKPIVFTDNNAIRRKYPITHYVGSSGELYEMVNYFNLTTTSPTYDTSYNRNSKDAFVGYMWLDLDNNRVVQITKDRLYYEGEPGLMEHKGTGTWTCPENGIYKIILVGGGAAGSSTGGGGSGHMKIAVKAYKKGDEIPYVIGAGEATFNSTDLGDNPSRTTWFDDEWAQPGIGNLGGANGYPASGGGGGGGYNLVDFGGNGQLIETVPRKNGGQGTMPAQGYGAGGAAGQPGADGCIVIIK